MEVRSTGVENIYNSNLCLLFIYVYFKTMFLLCFPFVYVNNPLVVFQIHCCISILINLSKRGWWVSCRNSWLLVSVVVTLLTIHKYQFSVVPHALKLNFASSTLTYFILGFCMPFSISAGGRS